MNARHLGQVHQVTQRTVVWNAPFVRGLSVWIVGSLGIRQQPVKSIRVFHWRRGMQVISLYVIRLRIRGGDAADSVIG